MGVEKKRCLSIMQIVNLAIGEGGLVVFRTCKLSYHTFEDIDWSSFDPDDSLLHIFRDIPHCSVEIGWRKNCG